MTSQRFCLRWNNHQSNLLSVFDQLLHAETFTDVTLAVEGQYLKAHKMVLSACSPYFQTLFINHPEKHPIVILKDVPFADMKSLLDFMYRGEVSVDQERLTAFLKVAESLRIKGLTEVSDDNKQTFGASPAAGVTANNNNTPPPQLHRIHPYYVAQKQQQQKAQGMLLTNPLLGSALTMPKRKRGRPRKLSGSSNGTGEYDDYESNDNATQGSPDMNEKQQTGSESFVKATNDLQQQQQHHQSSNDDNNHNDTNDNDNDDSHEDAMDTNDDPAKSSTPQPPPLINTAKETNLRKDNDQGSVSDSAVHGLLVPKMEPPDYNSNAFTPPPQPHPVPSTQNHKSTSQSKAAARAAAAQNYLSSHLTLTPPSSSPSLSQMLTSAVITTTATIAVTANQRLSTDLLNNNTSSNSNALATDLSANALNNNNTVTTSSSMAPPSTSSANNSLNQSSSSTTTTSAPTTPSKPSVRRRIRRKANSTSDDQAEQLTEMSVRGLNLFRYASITEGVYQCTECAKDNVQKTFKNKYSFQRHAFLYHEGTHRKVFPCPVCSKEFSRPDKMKNHMKTTHECYMPRDCVYPLNSLNLLIGPGGEMLKLPKMDGSAADMYSLSQGQVNSGGCSKNILEPNIIVTSDTTIKSALKANNSTAADLLRMSKMESIMASAHQFSQIKNE